MENRADQHDKILIVDDHPENIWPLVEHLEHQYEVMVADSGEKALKIAFSKDQPDLILLDIIMPGMDGHEVFSRLKADERIRDIPVIFLTSKSDDREQVKGLELGAQDYITKPCSLPVVSARIKAVLNFKKEMEKRALLKTQMQQLNRKLEQQVQDKIKELQEAQETLKTYEQKYSYLFQKEVPHKRGQSILVVDDDPENIHILMDNLEADYEIIFATSGDQALEIAFSKDQPDLILLDIMMPEMDGYEVCSRLKASTDTWDVPVIFISALGQEVDETKGLDLGAVDFIAKPFSMSIVKARIKAALRLKQEMDNRILLTQKLEDLNKNLEERVRKKTAALKKVHANLEVSEKKFRAIYENAIEGIFKSSPDGRLIDASPALARILGYASSQELVDTITDIAHQFYYRAEDRQAFKHALDTKGEVWDFETQFKKKNGDVIWVMICAKSVNDPKGNDRYYQGFVIDITARKQAEEALLKQQEHLEELVRERTAELTVAKEQAETANEAKSDFLARMSHEIRTPLNAVTGLTNVVLKSELKDDQREYLNKVQIASNNLLEVINDILDFSKVEAGQLELGYAPFDLDEIFERMADLFSNRVAKKDVELIFAIAPETPRFLIGDAGRLAQILTNLIENAVKFTTAGEIVVKVEPADPTQDPPGQTDLEFTVSDTGIGIARDALPSLFDPFTQAESYLDRQHEGSGLGLAICRRLVELMDGRIGAKSTLGNGSTFFFTARLKTQKKMKPLFNLPQDLHGLKTLVVDDSAAALQMISDLLKSFTFKVTAVSSGEEAIEALQQAATNEPYKLVLLDWKMPGLDGIETARRIHAMQSGIQPEAPATDNRSPITGHPFFAPIIVLVTAYGRELEQKRIDTTSIDTVLLKPIKSSALFNTIMELFGKIVATVPGHVRKPEKNRSEQLAGRRILVVEDSALNRDVVMAFLMDAGLAVEVAENGQMAVDNVTQSKKGYYNAVLMDIQMPVMDGYEATRRIRQWELKAQDETSQLRIPIIALTAHALKGEKEKCIAAGMDDYLAKPINENDLYRVLLQWVSLQKGKSISKDQPPENQTILDIQGALKRMGGRKHLYLKVLKKFDSECSKVHETIAQQLSAGDFKAVSRSAHTVKGTAASIGATGLSQVAAELEKAAIEKDSNIRNLLSDFKIELKQTLEALHDFLERQIET